MAPPVNVPTIQMLTPRVTVTPVPVITPAPAAPAPAAPVQVVRPPPPKETTADAPDGSSSCDCYEDLSEPVYENGEIVEYRPARRWTGTSPQCCPQQ